MDYFCYLCLVFVMPSRQFIAAMWSPAVKGLTYRLLFVMFNCFCYFPMWYPGSEVVLDCIDSCFCQLSYFNNIQFSRLLFSTLLQPIHVPT